MSLNLEAIQSQSIALGFVEVPACERLRALAAQVPADEAIVEIGAYKGRSTGWLALGASEGNGAHIYSIDCWDMRPASDWPEGSPNYVTAYSDPGTEAHYRNHLELTGISDMVTVEKAFASDVAKSWKQDGRPKIGLLWHDADHATEAVRADLKAFLPHMAKTAVIVAHDTGNPAFGVAQGVEEALTGTKTARDKWDWDGRQIDLWPKRPDRRGTLTVRTRA